MFVALKGQLTIAQGKRRRSVALGCKRQKKNRPLESVFQDISHIRTELHLPLKKADDWIIITDESVSIGQERLLVVLGIRRSEIDFTRSLKMQDLKTLFIIPESING